MFATDEFANLLGCLFFFYGDYQTVFFYIFFFKISRDVDDVSDSGSSSKYSELLASGVFSSERLRILFPSWGVKCFESFKGFVT